ncbi:MAG: thioredoxin [Treponema sp.]|uniref:thioredoxin n=1 Tax=Treponema sp. TaxID=166 RepID=UPI00257FFED3|nr:thioredoxin [Treponema sp.]MBQ5537885.1 thioredoxin [Treponema sp.]
MEITITNDNFESEVLKSDKPVLVDFWAPWCGPCKMMGPVVAEIAEENEGKIKVGKCDVDENGELAQQFGIMNIPCFILFKNGKEAARAIGGKAKEDLAAFALQ